MTENWMREGGACCVSGVVEGTSGPNASGRGSLHRRAQASRRGDGRAHQHPRDGKPLAMATIPGTSLVARDGPETSDDPEAAK
jgi:hypothetical protein